MGATISANLNNHGDLVFAGIVSGADIDPSTPPGFNGLGVGVFLQRRDGSLRSVVRPGDGAPHGAIFDFAENPSINDDGDVAFGAHVAGDVCYETGSTQDVRIFCTESLYLKKASGKVISLAHQGDPAPGGGTFGIAFGPVMNNYGQVVFIGDLANPPGTGSDPLGVFLYSNGRLRAVARPGDPLPDGGTLANALFFVDTYHINNRGDVTFIGFADDGGSGLFVSTGGSLQTVARTGTVLPGIGTVLQMGSLDLVPVGFLPGGWNNDRGEVVFGATVDDGSGTPKTLLLKATPMR